MHPGGSPGSLRQTRELGTGRHAWQQQAASSPLVLPVPDTSLLYKGLGLLERTMPLALLLKRIVDPVVVAATLYLLAVAAGEWSDSVFYFGLVGALLAAHLVAGRLLFLRGESFVQEMLNLAGRWLLVIGIVFVVDWIGGFDVSPKLLTMWLAVAPILAVLAHALIRYWLTSARSRPRDAGSAVIVGATAVGRVLAGKLQQASLLRTCSLGFFDDRRLCRLGADIELLGVINSVAGYVRENHVGAVYITLPMASQPRVLSLLDQLKDTTASIYFVPDLFVFDLIQARFDHVEGVPIISVCDSPFAGMQGVIKRCFDIFFAGIGIIMCAPLMLVIAAAIKLTSPGPVFFCQRRWGLNGETIKVYKFRTMTVLEDSSTIRQVTTRDDQRLTRIGRFLRQTSLDELPQLFNVLNGSMSLIGPRPHAIAHNELYRRLVKGYMIRHKVRPGITGWAQIHGFRGPTETVDLMERRVRFDLDYLRHWSLGLDFKILVRTVFLMWKDKNAY